MVEIILKCPYCGSENVNKYGTSNGKPPRKFSFITFFITSTFGHKFDTDFINKL